jgi:hypothetical protein
VERFRIEPGGPFSLANAIVLLHLWLRREGGPSYQRPGRKNA